MKNVYIVLIILLMQSSYAQSETTIYLIRHAEKADNSPDTALSPEGKRRAEDWAIYFKDAPIDLIYCTPYLRTKSTCSPIAISKNREILPYNPREVNLKDLIAENKGKTILIVGHSNTIPRQLNQLLGEEKYQEIPESEFGNLYIIKEKNGVISHSLIKV